MTALDLFVRKLKQQGIDVPFELYKEIRDVEKKQHLKTFQSGWWANTANQSEFEEYYSENISHDKP
jgi:hypothetical protein